MNIYIVFKAVSSNKDYFLRTGKKQDGYKLEYQRTLKVFDSEIKALDYLAEQENKERSAALKQPGMEVSRAEWNILDSYKEYIEGHRVLTRYLIETRELN